MTRANISTLIEASLLFCMLGIFFGLVLGGETSAVETVRAFKLVAVTNMPITELPTVTRKQGFYQYYTPTNDEIENLARMIQAEARGESKEGQMEVGYAILNRVRSKLHPNTINEVLFQLGQFSPISDGSFWRIKITDDAIRLAIEVLRTFPDDYQATYFMNPKTANIKARKWQEQNTNKLYTVGNHVFRADKNPIWRF